MLLHALLLIGAIALTTANPPGSWTISAPSRACNPDGEACTQNEEVRVGRRSRMGGEDGMGMTWQVLELERGGNVAHNTTDVYFELDIGQSEPVYCAVSVSGMDPEASWYAQPCKDGGPFTVSWGYMNATDSAVMTVCFPWNSTIAWFGYENVNAKSRLGDSKKESVHFTACQ